MFTNLLFTILILLLINFSYDMPTKPWIESPIYGLLAYLVLLAWIALVKCRSLLIINLELLLFFLFFFFFFGSGRLLGTSSQTLYTLFTLGLYLLALWVHHYTLSKKRTDSPCNEAFLELRMVIPFTIPFVIFTIFIDLFNLYPPIEKWLEDQTYVLLASSAVFLALILLFFPPLLQWIWKCTPLQEGELKDRLDRLCERARFKHAGMKIWSALPNAVTAAIIGVAPPFRYVMFTDRMLKEFSPESVEAVLAHEIGHNYHKHLLLYPLVIFGMLACVNLFSQFFSLPLANYFILQNMQHPSSLWETLYPILIFAAYAVIIMVYFRLVFGFFSRLFERQADLHVFKLNVPVQAMKEGLLNVSRSMGMPTTAPSWHHFSIQQRVDFLTAAEQNPALIQKHHRKVKFYFFFYLFLLGLLLWVLFNSSPYALDEIFNGSLRKNIADEWIEKYHLQGNRSVIENSIAASLKTDAGMSDPAAARAIAALLLDQVGEKEAAKQLREQK